MPKLFWWRMMVPMVAVAILLSSAVRAEDICDQVDQLETLQDVTDNMQRWLENQTNNSRAEYRRWLLDSMRRLKVASPPAKGQALPTAWTPALGRNVVLSDSEGVQRARDTIFEMYKNAGSADLTTVLSTLLEANNNQAANLIEQLLQDDLFSEEDQKLINSATRNRLNRAQDAVRESDESLLKLNEDLKKNEADQATLEQGITETRNHPERLIAETDETIATLTRELNELADRCSKIRMLRDMVLNLESKKQITAKKKDERDSADESHRAAAEKKYQKASGQEKRVRDEINARITRQMDTLGKYKNNLKQVLTDWNAMRDEITEKNKAKGEAEASREAELAAALAEAEEAYQKRKAELESEAARIRAAIQEETEKRRQALNELAKAVSEACEEISRNKQHNRLTELERRLEELIIQKEQLEQTARETKELCNGLARSAIQKSMQLVNELERNMELQRDVIIMSKALEAMEDNSDLTQALAIGSDTLEGLSKWLERPEIAELIQHKDPHTGALTAVGPLLGFKSRVFIAADEFSIAMCRLENCMHPLESTKEKIAQVQKEIDQTRQELEAAKQSGG